MARAIEEPEQLSLLSHNLAPLRLGQRVHVRALGYEGQIAQIWPGRDWYTVFSWTGGPGRYNEGLPIYRRDELDALEDV